MTDTTERKLEIATTELRRLSQLNQEPDLASASYRCEEAVSIASDALARIAAEDAPPAPDLAEIGMEKWYERSIGTHERAFGPHMLAAYAAMKAADPSCDPMNDPRVRELVEAATAFLKAATDIQPSDVQERYRNRLRHVLAIFTRKPSKGENTDGR